MEYLKPNELLKVLGHAQKHGAREHCMFLLGYGHALRASEIASLTLEDVRNGRIRCNRGKGSQHTTEELRENQNPLLDEKMALAAWLRERGDADGSVFLYTSRQGSCLKRKQVYNLFRKCAELASIEPGRVNPHILKHSYASHLLRTVLIWHSSRRRLAMHTSAARPATPTLLRRKPRLFPTASWTRSSPPTAS